MGATPSPVVGNDQVYAAGTTTQCYVPVSSTRDNKVINALLQQHAQGGAHVGITNTGGMTTDTLDVTSTTVLAGAVSGAGFTANTLANGHKFSYGLTNAQNSANGVTKVLLNHEEYDTGSDFDGVTNHRFTAPIDGFYHFDFAIGCEATPTASWQSIIYKNGSAFKYGNYEGNAMQYALTVGSCTLELAATDYIELYLGANGVTAINNIAGVTFLDGFLVSAT